MNLIPTIIQNADTNQVLMLGYSNEESLAKTKATGQVWFYSRSKQRLWQKGETSGNTLTVQSLSFDCDQDTILIQARPNGPTCHTGQVSCFGSGSQSSLYALAELITARQQQLPVGSYTTSLFQAGRDKIVAKVIEEAAEVVKAALTETPQRLTEEVADLIYHLLVLLTQQGVTLTVVLAELERRR
ncbi:MAG: bifunctional phosphoribosyl-AMP cyclohydrolase/phosphoribosyl-ATP diphosphatase HisIE [Candidatus Kerfeldbacteria bacterium]|nr:bifunctional phosphoribosyl-AMP cyclohydrolase/phosphoribosyl-ATP diphosphatase HisIE [Candidatus Kerfeldbacteria bacterium]